MANENKMVALSDILDAIKKFFQYYLAQKKLVLSLMGLAAAIALVLALLQSPKYDASTSFVLEEKSASGGGLAGIASQFGFDMSSLTGAGAGLFSGDNILDIVKSRVIVEKVLLSKIDSTKGDKSTTLADLYLSFSGKGKKISQKIQGIHFNDIQEGVAHTTLQDSLLFVMYEDLTKNNITVDTITT